MQQHGQQDEGENEMSRQVDRPLKLDAQAGVRLEQRTEQLARGFDGAFRPSELLRPERAHRGRKLRRHLNVAYVPEVPAAHLCTIAQVEVFGDRVALPSAGVFDALPAPQPCRAVEVEKIPFAAADVLLDGEMCVESHRLQTREERIVLIEVSPARLYDARVRIAKVRDRPQQEVGRRKKIGVEYGDETPTGQPEAVLQRTGFIALTMRPPNVHDVDAAAVPEGHATRHACARHVRRIIEDLDFEAVLRIIKAGTGVDQAFGDERLVVEGKLDRHDGPRLRGLRQVVPVGHAAGAQRVPAGVSNRHPKEVAPIDRQYDDCDAVERSKHDHQFDVAAVNTSAAMFSRADAAAASSPVSPATAGSYSSDAVNVRSKMIWSFTRS